VSQSRGRGKEKDAPADAPRPWARLGEVDVSALAAWLGGPGGGWLTQPSETKPQRVHDVPACARPAVEAALALLGVDGLVAHHPMLSRMRPGQSHPMHTDTQRADWVTRIHVPVTTNPKAWMEWEGRGRAHFQAGVAYTFDTGVRHAFGNDGDTDRVHLIFDVLEVPR
jgi:hypothetical protein